MMRLTDMAAVQPPSGRHPSGKDFSEAGGAFGELLDRDAGSARPRGNQTSREKMDEATLRSAEEAHAESVLSTTVPSEFSADPVALSLGEEPNPRKTATDRDAEPDTEIANGDTRLRPPGHARIDWLALRMPKGEDAAPVEQTDLPAEDALPVMTAADGSDTQATAAQDAVETMPDARLAAAAGLRRDERASDDRPRPSARPGTDAPARMAAASAEPKAADPAEPTIRENTSRNDAARSTPASLMSQQRFEPASDPRTGDQAARPVAAISIQTVPAFSAALQGPAQTVLGAIRDDVPELARSAATTPGQPQTNEPMRILKIQLHPLELGVVTARLSLQGGEMSVELQTETREAASKLAADSNEIAKALRGLGIEIDRVTVTQQPSGNMQSQGQQGQQGGFERSGERFASDGGESGRQHGQRGSDNGVGGFEGERNAGDGQSSRGVFI